MQASRSHLGCQFALSLVTALVYALPLQAQDDLRITEFAAVNEGPYVDEDGDKSDWIEIYNAGTNTANLGGWFLTDTTNNLKRWEFPATNLPPNSYLVVFASNKNRRTPGARLHTNFRLDANGEYLGLVKPDGITVVSAYAPTYPPQVGRVSFGVPVEQTSVLLVTSGAPARVRVPLDDSLGYAWTETSFDDSGWTNARTGVGFETDGQTPFVQATLANSVTEFSGTQGWSNWYYGYWNKSTDASGTYSESEFVPFPNAAGPYGDTNYWNGSAWHWFGGDPPWTDLSRDGGHPSANNGGAAPDHWAIRRYVSEANGPIKISGRLAHTNATVDTNWVRIVASGLSANSLVYVYLTAIGDGYIDDMKLVAGSDPDVGSNLLPNGDFESGVLTPWTIGTDNNMAGSTVVTNVSRSGSRSLRLIATAPGTTQASSIYQTIVPALTAQTYTLSYWYRLGSVPAPLTVRFSGNWITTSYAPTVCGDGVIGRIFVDGVEVYQQQVFLNSVDYSVKAFASLGSRIDFALDAGAAANDNCDSATFTAKIDTEDPNVLVVADSAADWSTAGTQGERNWYYGYYNKTADTAVPGYQTTNFTVFPRDNGPNSANNFWTGTMWDWFNGNPPWDEIGQTGEHPNGSNSTGGEHWVIRRWISQMTGRIIVDWTLVKANVGGGNGVTGRIFHNGVQMDSAVIGGTDGIGIKRTIALTNVQVGDFIDIALDATGTDGLATDSSDGSTMTAVMRGAPSVAGAVASAIETMMKGVNSSAYIRIPFVVTNQSPFDFLTLRMKYDDGFVAYLNGVAVAARNAPVAPDMPTWNSTAYGTRPDTEAVQFEDIDLTAVAGLVHAGTNVLAIHGLNLSAGDGDFLVLPELRGASLAANPDSLRYFSSPTPGTANGFGNTNLGPIIANVRHTPNEPTDDEDLYVTAEVIKTFQTISNVVLTYRVMFGNEVTVPMYDDGTHADGVAGDGVWGGIVPASAAGPAQMIRYFVYATDDKANSTRFPAYLDTVNSPKYHGTVVSDPSIVTALPVLHWFIENPTAANNSTGTKCSLFYLGRFYDNCGINLHGQSSSGFPKMSYDVDMNPGYGFVWKEGEKTVDDINLLSTWADKSHMRNMLAYDAYEQAGAGYHWVYAIRVQQNGTFHSLANLMENGDAGYLDRLGLNPNGALYKMYNGFNSTGSTAIGVNVNAEKKTRKNEGNADLVALYNGVTLTGQAQANYVFDNIDIPSAIGMLAGHVLANDEDCCHKNYYFYRDTEGTGEWRILPWDVDLSFGHTWTDPASGGYSYYDPRIYATNRYSQTTLGIGGGNRFVDALFGNPAIYQMYLRRVRTITDEQLQSSSTHPYLLKYENMVNTLAAQMETDAALDYTKWVVPRPTVFPPIQTLAQGIADLNANYFPLRRQWIYTTLASAGQPTDPYTTAKPYIPPQPTNVVILFGAIDFNPASGNQAQEFVQLINTNRFPVDVSDWRISGAIQHALRRGTVIPSNSVIYLTSDINAFRARPTAPRGGMGLFLQGNYKGQLSARGENLQLLDKVGRLVQVTNYPGDPSLAQQYLRVTEIMYHPAFSQPGPFDADEYEYIELKNTGPQTLSLIGVRFTNGIDFTFASSSRVTSLGAGESAVLVRNLAAFTNRYGNALRVAGEYGGALDNNGETIRLDDASGEKILEFQYDNKWYPVTAGFGFSLVIVNENAAWDTWGLKESWRPSGVAGGSPAANDPASPVILPVVINELLTHSIPPAVDMIELFNPTATPADISGWFITDDFTNAFKFIVPNGTVIPAFCFKVFTEDDFNPGGNGFAFSSLGDEAYLLSGNGTNLTGYIHGFSFDGAEGDVAFGRHINSLGQEFFVAQAANTFGTNNAGPKIGPVVLSEIMYHPPDLPGGVDNQDDEYVEIKNITTNDVPLFDEGIPEHAWQLRGAVDFEFTNNITLPAGGTAIVVSFDLTNEVKLAAFRNRYGISPNQLILGPYRGKLDNSSEHLKLEKPDPTVVIPATFILVDEVDYADAPPWPASADGAGASLQRVIGGFGNDPSSWFAAIPTPGADPHPGSPPAITNQPTNQSVVAFTPASFTVGVTGSEPLQYQWMRNGTNIPAATNSTLTLTPQPLGDSSINVAVYNSAGAAVSSNAFLAVLIPAKITQQPQSRSVFPLNTNISFTVSAASTSPVRYQWLFNGQTLGGATNPVYVIPTVQPTNAGIYSAVVTDDVGSLTSDPALLTVWLQPQFTLQPTNRAVQSPANATFSCIATSSTPIRYQWYSSDVPLTNGPGLSGATNTTLTVSNTQPVNSGDYWVVASDNYGSTTSRTATLAVLVKAVFTQQPASQTVAAGRRITLTAQASGTSPFYYRWRTNSVGTNVFQASATTSLDIPSATLRDAAIYQLVVSNAIASAVTSSNAYVVVVDPPVSQTAAPGSTATFRALLGSPTGTQSTPYTNRFSWLFNGTNVLMLGTNRATNAFMAFTNELVITNVTAEKAGTYTFLYSNYFLITNKVVVTNPPAPPITNEVVTPVFHGVPAAFTAQLLLGAADTDGDGMPDDWETANGLNPNDPSDASTDADGDGMTNLQEYLAGTGPQNPQSYLKIETAGWVNGGGLVVSFVAVSNHTYSVLYRTNLRSAAWQKLADVEAEVTTHVMRVTNNAPTAPEEYYRLRTPKIP